MSVISPALVSPDQHVAAVDDLVRQFRALGPDARVRLGKKTSNLFRFGEREAQRLDTSGLTGVIDVDLTAHTAQVQGMTTYETLAAATLARGVMPLVVPQLKTITLGGAVTGLGIESTSFRHGLPHESVRAMDVLLADGDIVTATPDGEHAELFAAFPNSYGTLGYALRLEIEVQPVARYVRMEHVRVETADLAKVITDVCDLEGDPPDFVDGTVFSRDHQYLTLGRFTDDPGRAGPSDYTGRQVFYRSIDERAEDVLTVEDYIWRWDTDWFWCSRALGVQHPVVRRFWPRRWRRSDVYRRIVALDRRTGLSGRLRHLRGLPLEEPVVQDVEIPVERLAEFLDVFHREVGITPVWLCPIRLRGERTWPLYPMAAGELYVNVGFWSAVPERPGDPQAHNRLIEDLVGELGGHKSLYSTVHYDETEFWQRYNGPVYRAAKKRYDPRGRLPDLFAKVTG